MENIWCIITIYFQAPSKMPDVDVNQTPIGAEGDQGCSNCDFLRCKILEPQGSREESNLDQFVDEFSTDFFGGNTTDGSNFRKCREKFLEENYPDISTGLHLHPPVFVANQGIHGFFPNTTVKQKQGLGKPPDNLNKKELKKWKIEKKKEVNKNLNASKPTESKYAEKSRSNTNEKTVFESLKREYDGTTQRTVSSSTAPELD